MTSIRLRVRSVSTSCFRTWVILSWRISVPSARLKFDLQHVFMSVRLIFSYANQARAPKTPTRPRPRPPTLKTRTAKTSKTPKTPRTPKAPTPRPPRFPRPPKLARLQEPQDPKTPKTLKSPKISNIALSPSRDNGSVCSLVMLNSSYECGQIVKACDAPDWYRLRRSSLPGLFSKRHCAGIMIEHDQTSHDVACQSWSSITARFCFAASS